MYNFSVITNVNLIRNTKYENGIVDNQVVIFDQYHKFSKINVSTPIVAGTRSKLNTLMYNYTISNILTTKWKIPYLNSTSNTFIEENRES